MLPAADNELLPRTGAGTPMGEYFRRYWLPVVLSRELPEPDGPPMRVQMLGEDLLAFRDTQGRVGLIEPTCAHRGAISSPAATKTVASAASITAGNSTSRAAASRCRTCPPARRI